LNGLPFQEYWFFESAAVRRSIATIVVVVVCAPFMLAIAPVKRPSYCPLPENVTFDRTQHPEIIGLYTGKWIPTTGTFYIRKFCILLTSIRGNEVRGIYSWETGGRDRQSDWRELEATSTSPFSTIRFKDWLVTNKDWLVTSQVELTLEFHKNGKATATYTSTGKGLFGLPTRTEMQSRLVKIE
jgi:hypothetical protein